MKNSPYKIMDKRSFVSVNHFISLAVKLLLYVIDETVMFCMIDRTYCLYTAIIRDSRFTLVYAI